VNSAERREVNSIHSISFSLQSLVVKRTKSDILQQSVHGKGDMATYMTTQFF
jgi:hypothetical protein